MRYGIEPPCLVLLAAGARLEGSIFYIIHIIHGHPDPHDIDTYILYYISHYSIMQLLVVRSEFLFIVKPKMPAVTILNSAPNVEVSLAIYKEHGRCHV